MSCDAYYDTHTLYIKCDCASAEQIRLAFQQALQQYQERHGVKLDCRFRVNLVENRHGVSFGFAFVFVSNAEVYYMLIGKNPDGSDRVEYVDDPTWQPPAEGQSTNDSGWTFQAPTFEQGMSWADMEEINEEYEKELAKHQAQYLCPKVPVPLDPLMSLPPFILSEEQRQNKLKLLIEVNQDKDNFDPNLIKIPEQANFWVDRAKVLPVESGLMHNVLKCSRVPSWLTNEDIKLQFAPYVSDAITPQERIVKGQKLYETYPFVNINNDRMAFVIFDPQTHDAQFALHMMKKMFVSKTLADGTFVHEVLIFHHSLKTDRDRMTAINQQPYVVRSRQKYYAKGQKSSRANEKTPGERNSEAKK